MADDCLLVEIEGPIATVTLNPAYQREEFEFYLKDLNAKALIVAADETGAAVEAAEALGISILRLQWDVAGPAGAFSLAGKAGPAIAERTTAGGKGNQRD